MTGYIIHYTDSSGSDDMITGISASSTGTDITGFTGGETYTISVEARSEHLSGESAKRTITLGMFTVSMHHDHLSPLTESPPAIPEGLILDTVNSTSVTVSWDPVADADRYTVTFTRATGEAQQGECKTLSHTASVSVDVSTTTASIDIGQNVEQAATDILRAYSTYSITVVAVNDARGSSEDSQEISVFTPQIGIITAS